ncbi:hypothetical protein GYMLUDRAFT_77368 [Collybiopsis luxurians FD-317 M1]|uniref:Amino acid permease/ SLC12A domain-containing protein n=1 Tax=Collybiopsis luxurians FD-317 M1 TaxID=944289 RepID=A0A0D0C7H9_9AGAR|nr:hypothetical protein GYMLUDRAFT_77368 [Collybiopsis luxurians FD-317 M1]
MSVGKHGQAESLPSEKASSLESGPPLDHVLEEEVFVEEKDLRRGLEQRHIQMIALAGTIGTGLFLGSGRALAAGGPVGACLGFLFTGLLISGVVLSLAELTALVPLSGSIIRQSGYFFDPALSFAVGWNYVYVACVSIPAEVTAAAVLIEFWTTSVSAGVWITVLGLLIISTNVFFIRFYGELEFGFAILKILLVLGLIIMGLVIDLGGVPGQHRLGFQYWRNPGPFTQFLGLDGSLGRFLGFWTTFSSAAYAYSGIEITSVAATETQNPRRNLPKAAKRIFIRILLFYILSIFIISLIVPSDNPNLLTNTGTAAQSPFVIVATVAGIKVVPHIVNAVVLTSAWSSANSTMLAGSRVLYGLAREGHAPKFFLRVNRFGIPYFCVALFSLFIALAYMALKSGAAIVFGWLQSLVAAAVLVQWMIICFVYLRFYYACKKQGIDRSELPWKGPLQPYLAWTTLLMFGLLLLTGGYIVFIHGDWNTESFFTSYFDIPLIILFYVAYKLIRRTKIVSLEDMPIQYYLNIAKENPEPPEKPARGWRRLNILWS